MRYILVLVLLSASLYSPGQLKPLGASPLELENFNFSTKIASLLPENYKQFDQEGNFYKVPSKNIGGRKDFLIMAIDTVFDQNDESAKIPVGLEYKEKSAYEMDSFAVFKNQSFNKINFATTMDHKIIMVAAVAENISPINSDQFISQLTNVYGKYTTSEHTDMKNTFKVYEWKAPDKTIKYAALNTVRLVYPKKVSIGEEIVAKKEPSIDGYFYILDANFSKETSRPRGGDFFYCK